MKKYLFIGSIDYSSKCLKAILEMGINVVGIMCPSRTMCKNNSDYSDPGPIANSFNKDVHYFKRIKDEVNFIKICEPDIIFVLGFSQIIPKEILDIPTFGCIGSHPALLPQNRGRHPIIWTLSNGLKKTGISLFWLDEGVDSGDIWEQKEFEIRKEDDALTIYKKVGELTINILKEKISDLENGIINKIPQDHSMANYWRKRTIKDGEIDWRMSSERIYNLVRALTKPYVGAHCKYDDRDVKIWKAQPIDCCKEKANLEPGKIIEVIGNRIITKTGDGLIELLDHEFNPLPQSGDYLL